MLGAINGNPLNLSEINSEGDYPYLLAGVSVVQAGSTSAAAGVAAVDAAASLASAAHTLISVLTNAIDAASGLSQAIQTLSSGSTSAISSSLSASNDAQGFAGDSTGAIAALMSVLAEADTLQSTAEAEAIKAVLQFIQDAQALSATGSVDVGASLDALMADQPATGEAVATIASDVSATEQDDQLSALLKMLLRHSAGAALTRHGQTNTITRHPGGTRLTVH